MRFGSVVRRGQKQRVGIDIKLVSCEAASHKDLATLTQQFGPWLDLNFLNEKECILLAGVFAAEAKRLAETKVK